MRASIIARQDEPVVLAEIMVAWIAIRRGDSVNLTAHRLQRPVPQVRQMLWGHA